MKLTRGVEVWLCCVAATAIGCASAQQKSPLERNESQEESMDRELSTERAVEMMEQLYQEVRLLSVATKDPAAKNEGPRVDGDLASVPEPSLGLRAAKRQGRESVRSGEQQMLSPERKVETTEVSGSLERCDDILGGDFWSERLRLNPSAQRFFRAESKAPFELAVYRRVSRTPEEFARVFSMADPAHRVSFVVESPSERTEPSDFVYEVQLLNRGESPATFCLKHW